METLTDLQRDIPTNMLGRNLAKVQHTLGGCFEEEDLMGVIAKRSDQDNEEIVVLDAACGTGIAIEEIARRAPALIEDWRCVRRRIRAIGIDLNPLPGGIPEEILIIDPRNINQKLLVPTPPLTEFRNDDVRTLSTVPSDSVDVLYSVGGLHYVDDCLQALESGFRTLKEGGMMALEVPRKFVSEPAIADIIKQARGASDVFTIHRNPSERNEYWWGYDVIVGEKKPGNDFGGFPWRMVSSRQPYRHLDNYFRHVVVGAYEKIAGDERLVES